MILAIITVLFQFKYSVEYKGKVYRINTSVNSDKSSIFFAALHINDKIGKQRRVDFGYQSWIASTVGTKSCNLSPKRAAASVLMEG